MEIIFKYRYLIILIIWFFVFDAILCCDSAFPKYGTITEAYDLEVGSTLRVKCTLFSHNLQENHTEYYVTSQNLILKLNNSYLENVEKLDDLSIQYTVMNASVDDTGIYTCYLTIPQLSYNPFVCTTYVSVGHKPLPVKDFSCISFHYKILTCTWKNPFNPVKTTYELYDYLYNNKRWRRKCPKIAENSCQWKVDDSKPYMNKESKLYFILSGSNSLGNYSEDILVHNFEIVKPAEPENTKFKNITKNSVIVQWDPPKGMDNFRPGLDYWLYYCPVFSPQQFCKIISTKKKTAFIQKLIPNTEYEFKLRCRSSVAKGDDLWSSFTKFSMKTHPDVPYLAPETTPASFQVKNIQNKRSIILLWNPVPYWHENGAMFQYMIDYRSHYIPDLVKREYNQPVEIGNYTNYTFSSMDLNSMHHFRIYARNSIGISDNYSVITVDKATNLPQKPYDIAVLVLGKGNYSVSWKYQKLFKEENDLNYTLFWCRGILFDQYKCKGSLNWMYTNNTKHELLLLDTSYQFAVAVNKNGLTSGMKWASCIVPYSGVLSKMKDITLYPKNSTSLLVKWSLNCDAQKEVVIEYAIHYCKTIPASSCVEPSKVYLKNLEKTEYILGSLQPFTEYNVSVYARTADGWSEDSDVQSKRTRSAAPDDSPQNVKAVSVKDRVIYISFQPPTRPNGKVTHYFIYYNLISHEDPHKMKVDAVSEAEMYEIKITKGTSFYSNYSIQVEACVNLDCSPRSKSVYAFTGVGVPGPMEPPHIEIVSISHINISWKPPEVANGPIDMYIVNYTQQYREKNNSTLYNVRGHEKYLILEISCSLEIIDVSSKIYAVNFKNDSPLHGNQSEPTYSKFCFPARDIDNKRLIVGLAVGISVGLTALVFIIYAAKWSKNGLKKEIVVLPPGLEENIYTISCPILKENGDKISRKSVDNKIHDSIHSSNINKILISIDSGIEVDLPPSTDSMPLNTSFTKTTSQSYKPNLDIIEEINSGNKDSELERSVSNNCKTSNFLKFSSYAKVAPSTDILFRTHQHQIHSYSKFSNISSGIPSYISFNALNCNLIGDRSFSNSEPSVVDFGENNKNKSLIFNKTTSYCKFGLSKSASSGELNLASLLMNQNSNYSKFGIVRKTFYEKGENVQKNNILTSKPLNEINLCPQINKNSFPMSCQVPNTVENIRNFQAKNIKKESEAKLAENSSQNPIKQGYINFHDVLNNSVQDKYEYFPSRNTVGVPNSAYSKLSLNSDVCNKDKQLDLSEKNLFAKNPSKIKNNESQLIFASSESSFQSSDCSSYVSFQNAKFMVANIIPPACASVHENSCSPNSVHKDQLQTNDITEKGKTTAINCCVNSNNAKT